jgi:hypothetical protein
MIAIQLTGKQYAGIAYMNIHSVKHATNIYRMMIWYASIAEQEGNFTVANGVPIGNIGNV